VTVLFFLMFVTSAISRRCRANKCNIWPTEVGKGDSCHYRRLLGWQHFH